MLTAELQSLEGNEKPARLIGAGGLPTYTISDWKLPHGSSLGNSSCWLTNKSTGAIEAIFGLNAGRDVFGSCMIRYCGVGLRSAGPEMDLEGRGERLRERDQNYVELNATGPGLFEIHPAYQKHRFTLPGHLEVEETVFLPTLNLEKGIPLACVGVRLHNNSDEPRRVRAYSFAELSDGTEPNLSAHYDRNLGALVATDGERPGWVRVVAFDRFPTSYEATTDRSLAYEPYEKRPLDGKTDETGDLMGLLQLDLEIEARGEEDFCWLLSFSDRGPEQARDAVLQARDWQAGLRQTVQWYADALTVSRIMVPEQVISDGILWAKTNMLRVMGDYPTGAAFTNDPGRSSNVVVRDMAWYIFGCDYLLPEYARKLLRNIARFQQDSGKAVEFWNATTGEAEDYGLNVNDDTPLFILAAGHHYLVTHDHSFLEEIYPAVAKACKYLLSQKDDRGLIFCTSTEAGERGICGWRNVIPNYRISGAVTEVNAECYAALRMAAEMGRALGVGEDVASFLDEAVGLGNAINQHLLNPENGLYYLTIDSDGKPNPDVTCDELFPVMFGVSPRDVAFRIISRLTRPDFWTPGGLRTASSSSPEYTPDREWGLRGGVWPGVSFWYAFAAARFHPNSMERALLSYQHYNEDPLRYNTVPGQFSEWFDGQSLANRGMRLSPWEPPRLVWAAIEGMVGVVHSIEGCILQPLVPSRWKWLAARGLPHAGSMESFFLARQAGKLHLYGNMQNLTADMPKEQYDRDVSDSVISLHPDTNVVALAREGEIIIFVGNTADRTITAPLELRDLLSKDVSYYLEIYDSELADWMRGMMRSAADLERLGTPLEAKGFRLFRLMPVHV